MEISMPYHASEESKNSTESIVARAQGGDKEAFGLIFEQHHPFVYRFIYMMLGDRSLAEEMTQETFLGAYRTIGSLRNDSAVRTWLCAIAKNTVYASFRQQRKEGRKSDDDVEELNLFDERPLPDAQFLNKELNETILSALNKLSEDKRVVFVLKEIQDLSYKEIAAVTGSSVPKLKTDLFRAKIEMRITLRSYMEAKNEL
jgi:RNA polymerase sigma-70 factor (ECF subfamily)